MIERVCVRKFGEMRIGVRVFVYREDRERGAETETEREREREKKTGTGTRKRDAGDTLEKTPTCERDGWHHACP